MDGALTAEAAWWECDTLLPWPDSSPSGLVTESFPPKSELHSDRRSSILLGMSSEVALIPAAAGEGGVGGGGRKRHVQEKEIFITAVRKNGGCILSVSKQRGHFSL